MLIDEEYEMNHIHDSEFISYDYITLVEGEYFSKKIGHGKFKFYSHNFELTNYDTAKNWIKENVIPSDTYFFTFSIVTYEY